MFRKDYNYGIESENKNLELINSFLNSKCIKGKKYDCYDFKDDDKKIIVELKTRRCYKNTYDTTMISLHKIKKLLEYKNYQIYIFFKFIDGMYYYNISEIYDINIKKGGRCDRDKKEYQKYYFIPVKKLILI